MVAALLGHARMFCNPFPDRGVELGLTLPAGPDDPPADFEKAVRKSFLEAGVFAALQHFTCQKRWSVSWKALSMP